MSFTIQAFIFIKRINSLSGCDVVMRGAISIENLGVLNNYKPLKNWSINLKKNNNTGQSLIINIK